MTTSYGRSMRLAGQQLDFADQNYLKDSTYQPYCHMCSTTKRMAHTNAGWRCLECEAVRDSTVKQTAAGVRRVVRSQPSAYDLHLLLLRAALAPRKEKVL
jgi:hypothetical protein